MEIPEGLDRMIEETRRRVQRQVRWAAWLGYTLPVFGVCLGFAVVTSIVHVPYSGGIAVGMAAAGLLAAAVLARSTRVDSFTAAARLDAAAGLKERLATVVEVGKRGSSGEIEEALLSDAATAARSVSPDEVLVFRAPKVLPLAFACAIAATAMLIAPGTFGGDGPAIPTIEQVALAESIRVRTTARLLKDRGVPQSLVRQVEELGQELEEKDIESAAVRIETVRASLDRHLAGAPERDAARDALADSPVLDKLAELLAAGAAPEELARETAGVMENDSAAAEELLRDLADRIENNPRLREEIERALNALEERNKAAFTESMTAMWREFEGGPGAEDLAMLDRRLQSVAARLSGSGGAVLTGNAISDRPETDPGTEDSTTVPDVGEGTALEGAMERDHIPERFRNLIRTYFARNEEE
jgi:hypothetical protein